MISLAIPYLPSFQAYFSQALQLLTQSDQHNVAKNDQQCPSLSATSAGILPFEQELQWRIGREKDPSYRKGMSYEYANRF
jgi:hypothetical protein